MQNELSRRLTPYLPVTWLMLEAGLEAREVVPELTTTNDTITVLIAVTRDAMHGQEPARPWMPYKVA